MHFLFDIGGTNIRLALVSNHQNQIDIDKVTKIPTPKTFEEGMILVKNYLTENHVIGDIESSIGGTTGVLNHARTKLINTLNLEGWKEKPLKEELSLVTQSNVEIYNDSALAALGEATYGIGKEEEIVVYITISTGIGGARIVNKKFDESVLNFEPGHQIINADGEYKYFEDLASGQGILKKYGKRAEEITNPETWTEIENYVAVGLNNILVHWSPDIVIIGGAVGKNLNLDRIKDNLKKVMRIYPELPKIEKSNLRHNGIHGALYLVNHE